MRVHVEHFFTSQAAVKFVQICCQSCHMYIAIDPANPVVINQAASVRYNGCKVIQT